MRLDELMTWAGTKAHPAQRGLRRSGHFGFFRSAARDRLWPLAAAWLESMLPPTAAGTL
jgi:hypothetical protein